MYATTAMIYLHHVKIGKLLSSNYRDITTLNCAMFAVNWSQLADFTFIRCISVPKQIAGSQFPFQNDSAALCM